MSYIFQLDGLLFLFNESNCFVKFLQVHVFKFQGLRPVRHVCFVNVKVKEFNRCSVDAIVDVRKSDLFGSCAAVFRELECMCAIYFQVFVVGELYVQSCRLGTDLDVILVVFVQICRGLF